MGYITEINWILKLNHNNGLRENVFENGKSYKFKKKGYRIYPVNIPIDLINNKWEVIAKIKILFFKCNKKETLGEYQILKIYKGVEKRILTKYWRENVEEIKNKKISNFNNIKLT